VIRVAAVGDLHVGHDTDGEIARSFAGIEEHADVLLLAGDLTTHGHEGQADVLAREIADLRVPVVAVLGNHDHHADEAPAIRRRLETAGVIVLERGSVELDVAGTRVGVVGAKGFGGGFAGACVTEFGEEETKAFARVSMAVARDLEGLLATMRTDLRLVLLHYSPVRDTLVGEPPEIYPFLGSYLLAEAADRAGADLIVHGHAHRGTERGVTAGGIPVRNVAKAVIRQAYAVYTLEHERSSVAP
jgi:Icc-related predicted phosphoesterase